MVLPLEKQVPTRETCERLRDAGFPIESHYVWIEQGFDAEVLSKRSTVSELNREKVRPAPTAAEFGVLLPQSIHKEGHRFYLRIIKMAERDWQPQYFQDHPSLCLENAWNENLSEALALLWLSLHEKSLFPDAAYSN